MHCKYYFKRKNTDDTLIIEVFQPTEISCFNFLLESNPDIICCKLYRYEAAGKYAKDYKRGISLSELSLKIKERQNAA